MFKAQCHHCFPKMSGLQILEKEVRICVRSSLQPLHWSPSGTSGCLPALSDSRWRQVKWWLGAKAGSQTTPDWWSLLEMKKITFKSAFFWHISQIAVELSAETLLRFSVGNLHSLSRSSEMDSFVILTKSSRGQSRAQPGNCKGYGGTVLSFRKNMDTEAELHTQTEKKNQGSSPQSTPLHVITFWCSSNVNP